MIHLHNLLSIYTSKTMVKKNKVIKIQENNELFPQTYLVIKNINPYLIYIYNNIHNTKLYIYKNLF